MSLRQIVRHIKLAAPRVGSGQLLQQQTRTAVFAATTPLLETKTIQVPTMGDSITEGTIVEWTVQVGQAVKDDDVVALIETDKVTVDIKAEMAGVVVEQFGAVDDTVEVGADLYVIDTEAEASVTVEAAAKDEPPAEVAAAAPTPAAQPTTSVPPSDNSGRKPSIQFLGKGGWERRRSGTQPISLIPDKPNGTVVLDGSMIDSRYGRPAFTEKEMEALILGGANIAPTVAKHSGGASFSI